MSQRKRLALLRERIQTGNQAGMGRREVLRLLAASGMLLLAPFAAIGAKPTRQVDPEQPTPLSPSAPAAVDPDQPPCRRSWQELPDQPNEAFICWGLCTWD